MKFSDILSMASANMLRNKARTILTIIAIVIGAMTISLTTGVGSGIKSYLSKQVGNLGANNTLSIELKTPATTGSGPAKYNPNQKIVASADRGPNSGQLVMTQSDLNVIKAQPNIVSVQADRAISADYIAATGSNKYQISVSQAYGKLNLDITSGTNVDNNATQPQITLPDSYVQALGFSSSAAAVGKPVTLGITNALGQQSEFSATIVGIQQKTLIGSVTAYVNTSLANQLYAFQSEGLPAATQNQYGLVVATFTTGLSDAQITSLKNDLNTKGYVAQTTKDQVNNVFTVINAVIIIFDIFGGIALLAASFGIVNTLLMSVQERTKEIGLMKALGMSPRKIFLLFSIEAVLIGFWGSFIGVVIAELLGRAGNAIASHGFLKDFPGLHLLSFPAMSIAIIMLVIMFIAFLAGTLPAFRASKKDPIEALRYE